MSGQDRIKPPGPPTGDEGDVTEVLQRGLPSFADDVPPTDVTAQHPSFSLRTPSTDETLPSFLEAYLEIVSGPDAQRRIRVTKAATVVGRGEDADARVHDTSLSKRHATILYTGSEFRIRDEGSTNGTLLNGSKVIEYALRDGDKLLVGDTLLRFCFGG